MKVYYKIPLNFKIKLYYFPERLSLRYNIILKLPLRKGCPYSELFWSVFSRIRTEFGDILPISSYSVRIRENTDQNNSDYGHFLRSLLPLIHMFLAKQLTSKRTYFFKNIPEVEDSLFYFLCYRSKSL